MEIGDIIAENKAQEKVKEKILSGEIIQEDTQGNLVQFYKDNFLKGGNRKFFETIKGELEDIPVDVFVNIKGKQRYMAQNADKLTNIIREVIRNPQAFSQIPGVGKLFNEVIEESGFSPINFSQIVEVKPVPQEIPPVNEALPA